MFRRHLLSSASLPASFLVATLALAACGGAAEEVPQAPAPVTYADAVAAAGGVFPERVELEGGVVVEILRAGEGLQTELNDTIQLHYRLYAAGSDRAIESSWDSGRPIKVLLGKKSVVVGLERALLGLRRSARARIEIPAALAYGATGNNAGVGPNTDVVFEIDLWSIRR